MFVDWVLFPLLLLAVCTGCGLLVQWIAGWALPGGLLPSAGLALVIVASSLSTSTATTAPLTTAIVVLLAVAGCASSWRPALGLRPQGWGLAVGIGVFACCAAPVVLSGSATFLGYFVLNDSAVHFMLIDQLLAHGHDLSSLAPSSYLSTLQAYLSTGYPVGADVAVGAVRPLVGQNIAWIFQPYLAVIMALGGVAIYELLADTVRLRPMRALCAFIAAQAGLVFAYYLEASIKEVATTWVITVTVTLMLATLARPVRLRTIAPLVVVAVAGVYVLDLAIVPWIGIPLAVFVVVLANRARHAVRRASRRRVALTVAGGAVIIAALAGPVIGKAKTFLNVATIVLTSKGDLGNLFAPLQKWQILGIWPSDDFRVEPAAHTRLTYALIGIAIGSAVLGAVWTIRRRAYAPLLLFVSGGIATLYLLHRANPYASAKVLMIFSLTAVLMAMLGAVALQDSGRRLEGWLLAAVIGGAVLWTNGLGYSGAAPAPRARLSELAAIGARFNGEGPAFYNQVDEFAVPFLRDEAPIDSALYATVVQRPGAPQRTAAQVRLPWDPDDLTLAYLESFRLLVLGRSPRVSRPPANFRLAYQGRYYQVWERTSSPTVLAHISLGTSLYPEAVPSCRLVIATAARATAEHAELAYVARSQPPALVPTQVERPPDWGEVAGDPFDLIPRQEPGTVSGTVQVTDPGSYQVWLQASLSQRFQVWVGGDHVGSVSDQLGPPGQFVRVGQITLPSGEAQVRIVRPPGNLTPGDNPTSQFLGPLMLVRDPDPGAVSEVAPASARSLCGRSLDWIEIVR